MFVGLNGECFGRRGSGIGAVPLFLVYGKVLWSLLLCLGDGWGTFPHLALRLGQERLALRFRT